MRTKLLALLSLGAAGLVPAATAQEIPLTRIDIDVAQEKAEIAFSQYVKLLQNDAATAFFYIYHKDSTYHNEALFLLYRPLFHV